MNPASNPLKNQMTMPIGGGERQKYYLHPGGLFVSRDNCAVTTILGSCVSVCLWDPETKIGGMNHYLLPNFFAEGVASPRFGDIAIKALIEKLLALGARKPQLRSKIFGGACVLEAFQNREDHLGIKNIRVARTLLEEEGIPLISHDVGGRRGRKLIFHTDDGAVWIREL
jgi:chemotaxis protein CheD